MSAENNDAAMNIHADMGDNAAHDGGGYDHTADQVHDSNDVWMPTLGTRQAPPTEHIRSSLTLPVFQVGGEHEPPGPWAVWVCKPPYPVAREDEFIRSDAIEWLLSLPNKRELIVRYNVRLTANSMNLQIGGQRIRREFPSDHRTADTDYDKLTELMEKILREQDEDKDDDGDEENEDEDEDEDFEDAPEERTDLSDDEHVYA
ncbi:hypothetical protein N7493_007382 [Penicillium malachiteum]|uniref:Uncharacterized protein n=1 Tax=Penicillium malachiteum TaxID=1324776 RepID=A0AAD6HJ88_9EURO|nr:hypothetical protein N7493_007382 [Penicillium malachiteum]